MNSTWTDFLILSVLTIAGTIQAVGRWRGRAPWLFRDGNRQMTGLENKKNRLGTIVCFPPIVFGSVDLSLVSKQGLTVARNGQIRIALYFLEYAGFVLFVLALVAFVSVYNTGKPRRFIPPQFRNQ